jgi:hypothetical protein
VWPLLVLTEKFPVSPFEIAQDERGATGRMGLNPFMLSIIEAFLEFSVRTN